MLRFLKGFFSKPTPTDTTPVAPYKVETPEAKVEAINAQPVTKTTVKEVAAPAKKAPAKKRTFVKREDSSDAKVKAPRKPRAPKAK
jgi:hypothetical protein